MAADKFTVLTPELHRYSVGHSSFRDGVVPEVEAAGGNGVALGMLAAWGVLKAGEMRGDPDQDVDLIGVAVCAAVLIMLPLVEDFANVFAGIAGGVVGAACGFAASLARRERTPRNQGPD